MSYINKDSDKIDEIVLNKDLSYSEKKKKIIELEDKIRKNALRLGKEMTMFTGLPVPGTIAVIEDFGTVLRGETERPLMEALGFESDYTAGGIGTSVLLGGKGVTSEFTQMFKLKRENRRLQNKINNSSGSEKREYREKFKANAKKIKKLHKEYYKN